jgi:hypothetical protein
MQTSASYTRSEWVPLSVIASTFGGELVWSSLTQLEVAEGLAAIGLLLLLSAAARSWGFASLLDSQSLNRHLRLPFSYFFAFLGVLGVVSFLSLGLCDTRRVCEVLDASGWNIVQYPLGFFGQVGGSSLGPGGAVGYGLLALMTWVVTLVFLSLGVGLARSVKLFAVPSLLFLTVVVLLFDPGDMAAHALNLVSGVNLDGMPLLSNWSLLTVSLFFTVYALARDVRRGARAGADGPPSTATGPAVNFQAESGRARQPGGIQKNRDD